MLTQCMANSTLQQDLRNRKELMQKRYLVVILLLIAFRTSGQIVNNVSSDKTNIYYHAFDSLVSIASEGNRFERISVGGSDFILSNFPDSIGNFKLDKLNMNSQKTPKIKANELRVVIRDIQIIRDEFKIQLITWNQKGLIGDGLYMFRYQYIPETMTYRLRDIKTGIRL